MVVTAQEEEPQEAGKVMDITMMKLLHHKLVEIWKKDFLDFMPFEEGGGAISKKYTKQQAVRKIQEYEMKEYGLSKEETCKMKDLELAYLNPPLPEDDNDWEWRVSRSKRTPLEVWAYFV